MYPFELWVADSETYPNVYLTCFRHPSGMTAAFEISARRDDSIALIEFIRGISDRDGRLVTFNGLGFDYPIWHTLIKMGKATPQVLYDKAISLINSENKFEGMIYQSDRFVKIIDLFRLKHYNNKARATSLKALEFNMRMDNISDLPFPVGTLLLNEQIDTLIEYCHHDVKATELFMNECSSEILFRLSLTSKLGDEIINADDAKIGTLIFQKELEAAGVQCYEYDQDGRRPRQTIRDKLVLNDAILPWIKLETPGFKQVLDWLRQQVITETKGVFKDLTVNEYGLDFVFGTGGIHAAVEKESIVATDNMLIESRDVSSYYPNLSIVNGFYPEHLGKVFCDIYKEVYETRKQYPKGSPMNAAYKLALNATFGKSNDKFSIFYDPKFMLEITLNGQLLLCLLAENLVKIPTVRLVMLNTDGLEYTIHPNYVDQANAVCNWWMGVTKLELEGAQYKKMVVLNVNNYIGEFTNGKVKRKGCFEYKKEWHQDASALVIPKVAEQVLLHDAPIRTTVENWHDRMDFMQRIKVPRSGYLEWGTEKVENTTRYYVAHGGKPLTKWLPPLAKKPDQWRSFAVESGWQVCVCNDIHAATMSVNYEYYIQEVEKLCLSVM